MFVAEKFISSLIKIYDIHPVSTNGSTLYIQARKFLNIKQHIHSLLRKVLLREQYNTSMTELKVLMIMFHAKEKNVKLKHVIIWLNLFADFHNKELSLK
jgi:putative transposase